MKDYNQYTYISPEGVVAEVRKKLNKYFSTNQLDEAMIGVYIENCIKKLGVGVLDKTYAILVFDDFKATLPSDFHKMNIAYKCYCNDYPFVDFSSNYIGKGYWNKNISCTDCSSSCDKRCESWEILKLPVPGLRVPFLSFHSPELLYVGVSKDACIDGCKNFSSNNTNEIYINGRVVTSNFRTGFVFLSYYAFPLDLDNTGYPMIVDEIWMKELIQSYLLYQFYDDLYNDITDETSNQIASKRKEYQQDYNEKLIIARTQGIAPTRAQIADRAKKDRNRLNPFNIR